MYNPAQILLQAEQFRRSAIVLEGRAEPGKHLAGEHVITPILMCYAFATELYLKFLIRVMTGTDPPNTHDLVRLYHRLPPEVALAIRTKWENPTPGVAMIRRAVAAATQQVHPGFSETLERSRLAFLRLRYPYQFGPEALEFLGADIGECARKVIFASFPTEFSHCRLPLPPGAINQRSINGVSSHAMNHPLRGPGFPGS